MANLQFQGCIGGPHHHITSPYIVTGDWNNFGPQLSVGGARAISLWLDLHIGDSHKVHIRILAKHNYDPDQIYAFTLKDVNPIMVKVNDEMIELRDDVDQKIILCWTLDGLIPFVQFQAKAILIGDPAAEIMSAHVTTSVR